MTRPKFDSGWRIASEFARSGNLHSGNNTASTPNLTKSDTHVGFIGLGDQGAPMARAVARAGWSLHVWARREVSLESVAAVPHTVHKTVAELGATCDLVGLCVRDGNDVEEMLEGQGLLKSMALGSIIVNHGTGSPYVCLDWDVRAKARRVAILDAPVSGGRDGAEKFSLTTIVGGDVDTYERCKPVFESFSQNRAHGTCWFGSTRQAR